VKPTEQNDPQTDQVIEQWLRDEVVRTHERVRTDPMGTPVLVEETEARLQAHMDRIARQSRH
jgi:hypothetical protein